MVVKVKQLGPMGHAAVELSVEDAEKLIYGKGDRYFVVDEKTKKVIQEVKLEDGQEIALIPK